MPGVRAFVTTVSAIGCRARDVALGSATRCRGERAAGARCALRHRRNAAQHARPDGLRRRRRCDVAALARVDGSDRHRRFRRRPLRRIAESARCRAGGDGWRGGRSRGALDARVRVRGGLHALFDVGAAVACRVMYHVLYPGRLRRSAHRRVARPAPGSSRAGAGTDVSVAGPARGVSAAYGATPLNHIRGRSQQAKKRARFRARERSGSRRTASSGARRLTSPRRPRTTRRASCARRRSCA